MSIARTQAVTGRLRGTPYGRTLRRTLEGFAEIQIADRSLALAAQIFTSVLPVMIAASVISGRHGAANTIRDQFGFDSGSLGADTAATPTDPTVAAFGVVGLLVVLLGGTSFARALGRVYQAVWKVPAIGGRDAWRWLAALLLVATAVGVIGQARELTGIRYAGPPLALLIEVLIWSFVWMLAPFLLTKGALNGRLLWISGVLTAIGLSAVHVASRIVLPHIAANAREQFGPLGLAFTSISWLFVQSLVIVGAAAVVKAFALDETAIGGYLRGREHDDNE
ncbi:hypothetical protein [Nocardia sp. NPDC005366]|uniref:hypothetical protein n=1 Tax=Nocardia sp. NPDC005366 TaxID=3156878 RepID=UPI0033A52AFA